MRTLLIQPAWSAALYVNRYKLWTDEFTPTTAGVSCAHSYAGIETLEESTFIIRSQACARQGTGDLWEQNKYGEEFAG